MENLFALKPGEEIGGFRILEKIHEGGMAAIYRVSRPDIDLPLIMKIPKLAFGSHPACYVGFEVEQMILATLSGPHVPRFIAKGDMETSPYIVMEYIGGPSLHDFVNRSPAAVPEIARLVSALAAAVHDLHRQNVVHLDIKPANVLYRPTGEAVLIDFGLARHAYLPDLVEEEFHMPVGTAAYISPEQVVGRRCDPRSDIFAIGVILYQLSTGCLPFGSPTHIRGFRKRLYRDPVPPRSIKPDLPEWLQEIILHCLEVRASDRYATAAQVACDLSHPDHVSITSRGTRLKQAGCIDLIRRRWEALWPESEPCPAPSAHLAIAPHIMVALDTTHIAEDLFQALRDAVRRVVATEAHCRITCVTILEPSILTEEDNNHQFANSLYTQRLVELRHWAKPLALPGEKVRYHVLEATDPAAALLEYARANHVDQIIMGARGCSTLRRILGSVSSKVAAEAPCSVTVVRVPRAP
ncbi:MAG: protein kinase domain-containing protein [Sulfuricella sp.]|nr:bifunctional serine/threonine-protein kinase/universal stress protein [Gammaproteobacteria bacterium]